jgi:hypothetical protein
LNLTKGRKSPFFEFPSSQLFLRSNAGGQAGFYSFGDQYKKSPQNPYAYFSNYGTREGYNRYGTTLALSDCTSLGLQPYFKGSATQPLYENPSGFQIICAGADGKFGPGGFWTGTAPATGADDQSNFTNGSLLGAGN